MIVARWTFNNILSYLYIYYFLLTTYGNTGFL